MEELNYITTHEGFVETCLDLRDSMYFYDKALILAGYASSVEMLMSLAMFWATLEGTEAADGVFDEIASTISSLDERLRSQGVSMDIAALTETFLQTSGWVLEQRYVVFREMFHAYGQNDYSVNDSTDELLRQIQLLVEQDDAKAAELMGRVGAMALRGVEIRPVWFLIARPRLQMWLRGVLGAIQNFAAAAHFSFPVDTVEKERQKWRVDAPRPVVDLKTFRNLRYPMMPTDTPDILQRGELDDDLLELFREGPLDFSTRQRLSAANASSRHVLLAILETGELTEEDASGGGWAPVNVMGILKSEDDPETITALLGLLGRLRPGTVLYGYVMETLVEEADVATGAALNRLKEPDLSVAEALALINFLDQVQPAKVYPALVGLLSKAVTFEEKLAVAHGLLQTGDTRAIPHLRRLGASIPDSPYGAAAKEFLDMATRQMRAKQRQKRRV